jgi:hypothetical protein
MWESSYSSPHIQQHIIVLTHISYSFKLSYSSGYIAPWSHHPPPSSTQQPWFWALSVRNWTKKGLTMFFVVHAPLTKISVVVFLGHPVQFITSSITGLSCELADYYCLCLLYVSYKYTSTPYATHHTRSTYKSNDSNESWVTKNP